LQNGRCPYTAGAAEGISRRVIFTDFSSRMPGKIFRKNSGAIDGIALIASSITSVNAAESFWAMQYRRI
jgi:hypothetical protein